MTIESQLNGDDWSLLQESNFTFHFCVGKANYLSSRLKLGWHMGNKRENNPGLSDFDRGPRFFTCAVSVTAPSLSRHFLWWAI